MRSCSDYLKPIAEEERKIEEAEKKAREEQERIYKQLSEGNYICPCLTQIYFIQKKSHTIWHFV